MSTSLVDALVEMAVAFDAEANRAPMRMPRFRPYTRYMAPGARWLSQFRGQVYVIEGNIGSGKTTLGHLLTAYFTQRGLKAVFLPEKVPEDMLVLFIDHLKAHPKGYNPYAAKFQMAVLEERRQTYLKAQELKEKGYTVFVDRSLPGDYVLASVNRDEGRFTPEEWAEYESHRVAVEFLEPDAIIFINTPPPECKARLDRRNRVNEASGYDLDYLQKIDARYHQIIFHAIDYPCLRLPWGKERRVDDPEERDVIAHAVMQGLEQLLRLDRDGHVLEVLV